jgi:electron transfer flavoprotein alpha/beta subunit
LKPIRAFSGYDRAVPGWAVDRHWPNPLDLLAVEEARRLVSRHGGRVTALTVGPPRAEAVSRKALMMGVDGAVRIWREELEAADSFGIAAALAPVARELGFDLLLCGARSADTGSELFGAIVADMLDVPLVTRAARIEFDPDTGQLVVDKRIEKGQRETYGTTLPAVVTVEEGAAEPRYCDPGWVPRVLRGSVPSRDAQDLALRMFSTPRLEVLELGPPRPRAKRGVRVSGLSLKEQLAILQGRTGRKQGVRLLEGDPDEIAGRLGKQIREWLR